MKWHAAVPRFISCHAARNGQIKAAARRISLSPPRHFAYRANFDTEMLPCLLVCVVYKYICARTTHPEHKSSLPLLLYLRAQRLYACSSVVCAKLYFECFIFDLMI
jgi:hypothetical protein